MDVPVSQFGVCAQMADYDNQVCDLLLLRDIIIVTK